MDNSKMKSKPVILLLIICTIIVSAVYLILRYSKNQMKNTVDVSTIGDIKIVILDPVEYIELPSRVSDNVALAATGISYDENNQSFYIGNYGKGVKEDDDFHPSILSMSQDFSTINSGIFFDDDIIDIQGIAYDGTNESLWYTNGDSVINCKAVDGKVISNFTIGEYSKYKANGICIDIDDGSLWILCMYKYLLNFSRDGELLGVFNCEYIGQDHICMDGNGLIYISAGIDYQGENNYVICMDRNANIRTVYRVEKSYAIEGILILDGKLYVVNDGIYHEAKIRNNYIQVYDIP